MQRILVALVALISLFMIAVRPTQAQDSGDKAVEPTTTPQEINGHAGRPDTSLITSAPSVNVRQDHVSGGTLHVTPEETFANLSIQHGELVLEGQVTGDVLAIESQVTIKRGARVGGTVVAIGGNVTNDAGRKVRVVRQNPGVLTDSFRELVPAGRVQQAPAAVAVPHRKEGDWFGGLVALLALGIVGGLILLIVAPRATHQVASVVSLEPARCLVVGFLTALGMLVASLINAGLIHSPLRVVWMPVGVVLAIVPLLVLAFGWLCGMRFVGDVVARKFGNTDGAGRFYTRMALGLVAFFVANLLLGVLHLGGVGLFAQGAVALMGLGAMLITGGGTDPDWLGARMRGERRWFYWKR